MKKNKAVFLDRDGTINCNGRYIGNIKELRLLPGAASAIRKLNKAGFKVIVVTNQSGIARGYFPESAVKKVNQELQRRLKKRGAYIDKFYYCPHYPEAKIAKYRKKCYCRKPAPGMLFKAASQLNINLKRSFMVGDMPTDIQAGNTAGCKTIFVLSGLGKKMIKKLEKPKNIKPDFIVRNLFSAIQKILS